MRTSFSLFTISIIFIIVSFPSSFSIAQEYGKLRGFVTDSTSGEALAFGNVLIEEINLGASTDERGMFLINKIPANNTYEVTVSYVGFKTKIILVFIKSTGMAEIDIALIPLSIELQTIEKIGERTVEKNATNISIERIPIKQLDVLPLGVESDIFKYIQFIPGVSSTGDISAKYYVRGGDSDQNLVQLNGVTIYTPYHSLGLFSAVDPAMINSAEFLKGAFSSEYGGRLSSVMNIVSKDGNKKRFGLTASVSSLTAKGILEGPIPNGSFLLSARKSYSTDILNKFLRNESVPIDFYDLSFKLNYSSKEIFSNARFSLFGFASNDVVDYNDPLREKFNWENKLLGFEWLQIYDVPLITKLGISISNFEGEVIPNASSLKPQNNSVNDVNLSFDMNVVYSNKDEIGGGMDFKFLETKFFQENRVGVQTNLEKLAGNLSIYGKYKFLRFENFGADVGARFNVTGLTKNGSGVLEPRVNLTYRLFSDLALKGAWGIYLQEVTTLSDEDELISVFEPWIIIPDNMEPSKSTQYNIGLVYDFVPGFSFTAEGFYKTIKNLPIINDQKFLSNDPDLITGEGESYGWEFLADYGINPVSFSVSYTLSWAYKEADGWIYFPKYDARHRLNLILEYNLGSGWVAGAIWNYSSGLPFTQLLGYYDKFYLNDIHSSGIGAGEFDPFSILDDRNLGRLPDYHRLDLSITKRFQISFSKWELSLSAVNIYDRQNVYYFDRKTGEIVYMLPFFVSGAIKLIL
ncbi:MAG: TonB-dependent receptor [Candidatus Neomarinimicrobiota bacterium]